MESHFSRVDGGSPDVEILIMKRPWARFHAGTVSATGT